MEKAGFFEFLKALGNGGNDNRTNVIMLVITAVNIVLTALKAIVTYLDGSMSILSSALESFGDVFACIVIGYNRFREQTADPTMYPRGRNARAQGYNVCAYIMIISAFACLLIDLDRFLLKSIIPELTFYDLGIMVFNIFCKGLLWLVCRWSKNDELDVLKMDQQNDLVNNFVTIVCVICAIYISIWADLIGAVIICFIIVRNWAKVHSKNNKRVHGHRVKDEIFENLVKHINELSNVAVTKEVVAYYRGYPITVEVYVDVSSNDFHQAADELREHILNFENVQTVHVFPADPRKNYGDVENSDRKMTASSCTKNNTSPVINVMENECSNTDKHHTERSPLNAPKEISEES